MFPMIYATDDRTPTPPVDLDDYIFAEIDYHVSER